MELGLTSPQNSGANCYKQFRYRGEHFDLSSGIYTDDFISFGRTASRQILAKPGCGTAVDTITLPAVEHSVAYTRALTLTPGVDYILEFEFWSDTDGDIFFFDMMTPSWVVVDRTFQRRATTTPQKARVIINSSSAQINFSRLRFFYNSSQGVNVGNVYITNVRLYNREAEETGWFVDLDNVLARERDFVGFTRVSRITAIPPGRMRPAEVFSITPIIH